jgi:DNA-binding NarL/FixJ family response regulator
MRIAFILSRELGSLKNQKNLISDLHANLLMDFYVDFMDILQARERNYDIIFYDIGLDPSITRALYKKQNALDLKAKIILLSNREIMVDFKKVYKRGVNGVITKELSIEELAILIVSLIKNFQLHHTSKKQPHNPYFSLLTDREKQILKLFINGLSYKEVGHQLDVRLDTVRSHIRNIYKKLNVRSKTEAVMKVMETNIIE